MGIVDTLRCIRLFLVSVNLEMFYTMMHNDIYCVIKFIIMIYEILVETRFFIHFI